MVTFCWHRKLKCPILGRFQRFGPIRVRLEQQHVVLQALLIYKILWIFYQELNGIAILSVFSYPVLIHGIRIISCDLPSLRITIPLIIKIRFHLNCLEIASFEIIKRKIIWSYGYIETFFVFWHIIVAPSTNGICFDEIELDQTEIPPMLSALKKLFNELERIQGHSNYYWWSSFHKILKSWYNGSASR